MCVYKPIDIVYTACIIKPYKTTNVKTKAETMTIAEVKQQMISKIEKLTDEQIIEGVKMLTKEVMTSQERMTRAFMFDVYGERNGVDAEDKLIDEVVLG